MREIERRIQRTEAQNSKKVIALDAPLGVPDNFVDHANLLFDLLAVAYQSDLTRVFSFMMSREASQRTYPELNIPGTHHDVSHHGGRPENMENHAKINLALRAAVRGASSRSCKAMPEGDGTVLDNSLVFFGAGMSDGQAHAPYPLPLVAVGSAGGKVKGDRHIVAPEWTPVANLWLQRGRCLRHASRLLCREHRPRRGVTRRSEPAMRTLVRTSTLALLALTAAVVATAAEAPLRLIDAVKSGNREVVRTLLKQPAELKVTERDGTTALHWAVRADDLEMVRMLLRAGADAHRGDA